MNRKIHLIILSISILFCNQLTGQTKMSDVFASMPDSIIPYLTKNNRLDCIDFINSNMEAVVTNSLGGKCQLIMLTDDSLSLKLSDVSSMELKLVPRTIETETDTVICMKRVFLLPEKDTREEFFTIDWKPIDALFSHSQITKDVSTIDAFHGPSLKNEGIKKP